MDTPSSSEQIRNLIGLYAQCSDRGDATGFAELFAPDAFLHEHGQAIPQSRLAELVRYFDSFLGEGEQPRGLRHLQTDTVIHTLTEQSATATTHFVMLDLDPKLGWHVGSTGTYFDEFVRLSGRWYFQRREARYYRELGRNPLDPDDTAIREAYRAFAEMTSKR